MKRKLHWEQVYESKRSDEVSWFQPQPVRSLELLDAAGIGSDAVTIDIGGGDSTLVDALLDRGFRDLTVLDVSAAALARARSRLGDRAAGVTWIEADVTRAGLPAGAYDVWHDRAVFHFLTDPEDRSRYVALAAQAVRPGGTLIVATFAPDGPTRCSGLEVARYDVEGLAREFAEGFVLTAGLTDVHRTPAGGEQRFTYASLRRRTDAG
jgi:SAM-dependent methyltransferase